MSKVVLHRDPTNGEPVRLIMGDQKHYTNLENCLIIPAESGSKTITGTRGTRGTRE